MLTAHEHRIRRAVGKGYPDLLRLRSGTLGAAPDAVVMPGSAEQVAALLEACASEGVAVVPFGGGTSVVGGVEPIAGAHERVIAMDMRRMRAVEIDPVSMTATLGPGLRGPEAEDAVRARGFTIGHFPQSFEYATVGGFAATRSAGQASAGYGRFDELVTSLAMVTPVGELRTLATPHTAAGPALREVALGSEGVLGAITEVTVRLRPAPAVRRYEAWVVPDFASGRELVRSLAQADALADVTRLSDEAETRVTLALAGDGGAKQAFLGAYLRLRRRDQRLPRDLRLGGGAGVGRAPARAGSADAPPGGRGVAGPGARPRLGPRPLPGAVPARRADRQRLHDRDPGDLAHLGPPR